MTKISKLYQKLIAGRQLTFAEFQTLILAFGFELDRIKGSHHLYKRPGLIDRVNAQPKGKDAKPYQVRQFLDIIEANGMKLDESE